MPPPRLPARPRAPRRRARTTFLGLGLLVLPAALLVLRLLQAPGEAPITPSPASPRPASSNALLSDAETTIAVSPPPAGEVLGLVVPPEPFPSDAQEHPRGEDPRHAWLVRWAARDFSSALAWARQQNQPLRDWALAALAHLLSRRDPAAALRLCETEELTLREPGHVATVFQRYAAAFPEKAVAWAAALPPGRLRDLSADALFAAAAEHAPEIAGELVLHNAGENPAAFVSLLGRWAQIAPARAGDWLAARPVSELQGEALELLLAQWASVEHEPAAAWIATLPPGPFRARAEAAFALHRPVAPLSPGNGG